MTSISPLKFIHKKGVFGNHYKTNEKDLIKISEIKDLNIFKIYHYKKSTISNQNLKIDNLRFPIENSKVNSSSQTRVIWSAPRTWLIITKDNNIAKTVYTEFDPKHFGITDISNSRAVIQIEGFNSIEILKKGSPINFNEFKKDDAVSTVFHGINILIDFVDKNPDRLNLFCLRSFGETFYHHITDASLEYGYNGN